jgi:nucleolar protein 14
LYRCSKVKGEKGNALKARSAGVTKRKNTLLKEYQASGSANAFVDRRFGEDNPTMTPEERSIGRLARTRLRQLRPGGAVQVESSRDPQLESHPVSPPLAPMK